MYGTARLTEYLNANIGKSPEELLPEIRETINAFDDGKSQFDDITMLMLCLKDRERPDEAAQ